MLQLIDHIVRTSARRDRTEINRALVEAVVDLFSPVALRVYRCFTGTRQTMTFDCAGLTADGQVYIRNAYLPERRFCRPIEHDVLLKRCQREASIMLDVLEDGANRIIFPVIEFDRLYYLIDITVAADFSADRRVLLMGLTEYFSNHVALLDYGETDTLTGLANRKTFDKHLFEVLGKAAADDHRQKTMPARRLGGDEGRHWLAVFDIDHFKRVNDTYGHLIGDEVLVMFARLMFDSFRYDDQLFRFGGEEFIAVLQPANREQVFSAFERFRHTVSNHTFSRVGHITVSIGYSQLTLNDTPADVIDRADEALYYAKQHGRNQSACYEALIDQGKLAARSTEKGEIELF